MTRKTKAQLQEELAQLREQVAELEAQAEAAPDRERQMFQMIVLNEINQALASTFTLDEVLEVAYQQVGMLFDATNFFTAIYREDLESWEVMLQVEHGERQPPLLFNYKPGTGLTSYIIQHRLPILLRNSEERRAFFEAEGLEPVGELAKSWMGVPLLVADDIVGVMAIQSYTQENAFDESDLEVFSTIAGQMASAIQKAWLFDQTQLALKRTQALYNAGRAAARFEDLEMLLQNAVDGVAETLPAHRVKLVTFDLERQAITNFVKGGVGADLIDLVEFADLWEGLSGWVLRELKPALSSKGRPDPREGPAAQQRRQEIGAGAVIVVPIISWETILGTLTAINRPDQRDFTQHDVDLMMAMANQVAVALQNAELFQEREQRVFETSILNEIGQSLSVAMDREQVLEVTYRQVGRLFDTRSFYIATYEEGEDAWTLAFDVAGGERQPRQRIPLGEGITSYIIDHRLPVLLRNVQERDAFYEAENIDEVGARALSWMGVPLIVANQVVGVMGIESYERENLYTDHDLSLFYALAAPVANAIYNARSFEQLQQQAVAERDARDLIDQIRRAADTEAVLRIAVRGLRTMLGARTGVVRLGTSEQLLRAAEQSSNTVTE